MQQNVAKDDRGKERVPLADFVITYLERKHGGGGKAFKKQLKAFVTGLLYAINHPETLKGSGGVHSWLVLFARLCGFTTPSGKKMVDMPPEASRYITSLLARLEPLIAATRSKLPACADSELKKALVGGKNAALIGFIEASASAKLVTALLKDDFNLPDAEFSSAVFAVLRSTQRTIHWHKTTKMPPCAEEAAAPPPDLYDSAVVDTSADLLATLACVWTAVYQSDKEKALGIAEAEVDGLIRRMHAEHQSLTV